MITRKMRRDSRGSLMITVLIIMTSLSLALASLFVLSSLNLKRASQRLYLLQAQYSAESGADIAISRLNAGSTSIYDYSTVSGQSGSEVEMVTNGGLYRSTYQVKVEEDSPVDANSKIITAIGRVYTPASSTTASYKRTIRVSAKRSATATAASLISRNVLQVASSVKNIVARDLYVNKYIQMDKNVNIFTVENLTVAGEITVSGTKCSITGGNVYKPSTFTKPGQTQTVLNLAYNNCSTLQPPASDFIVNENQTDIEEIQSTYIPYTYAMSSGYSDAGTCSDLTTGVSPRKLPLVAGSKKTNYPNASASGVDYSSDCVGASGTINLGSNTYEITDHVHIRANLCTKAMACRPTFVNNSGKLLYVFVEGSIAFRGVKTGGSDPIVFVAYGDTTESSIVSACPIGGAVYIGGSTASDDMVVAPKAYFIAVNGGFCIDKVKFPSLGGVSGKNVYIASQQGEPFSLSLDPNFPVEGIPVNLSWRAATYERL